MAGLSARGAQYEEGEAFLRMKGVLTSDNPAMWDTVFYRIKYSEHPHSGRCRRRPPPPLGAPPVLQPREMLQRRCVGR